MTNTEWSSLDEEQEARFAASRLSGDAFAEYYADLKVQPANGRLSDGEVQEPSDTDLVIELDSDWRMRDGAPAVRGHSWERIGGSGGITPSEGIRRGWWHRGADRSDWRAVSVPTTVQAAMVKSGELADPLWSTNTMDVLEREGLPVEAPWNYRASPLERREWWFACSFEVPAHWAGKGILLRFCGILYSASFYVNGSPLGHHAGALDSVTFRVESLLDPVGRNEIVIRFDPTPADWYGIMIPSPGFGWHYGHLVPIGPWKPVQVAVVARVAVSSVYVRTARVNSDAARLTIEFDVSSERESSCEAQARISIWRPSGSLAVTVEALLTVSPGIGKHSVDIEVPDPDLWWPVGLGDQAIYELKIELSTTEELTEPSESYPPSVAATRFGIRTIAMRPLEGTRPHEYAWQFVINDTPIFVRGANWCWIDPMMGNDPKRLECFIELVQRAGVNMLRAWGGGIIESEEFYRLCDDRGILVYQEFPFCWGPPDPPHVDLGAADRQTVAVVRQLRNHPCLVMWGGGNENEETVGADEGLDLVGRRCRQLDPSRPYHRTDPWGGSFHGYPYHEGLPPLDDFGNEGNWKFWGEFGLPSMPAISSMRRFLPAQSWPPTLESRSVIAHLNQFDLGDILRLLPYASYGPVRSWEDYVEYSQLAQADMLSLVADRQRARSYRSSGGFWFYKMTDLFPGQSWGVLDYYGQPKAAYYRALQVCRPTAAFATYDHLDWKERGTFLARLHLGNDLRTTLDHLDIEATLYGGELQVLERREFCSISVESTSLLDLGTIESRLEPDSGPYLLDVRCSREGSEISDRYYWFDVLASSPAITSVRRAFATGHRPQSATAIAKAFAAFSDLPSALASFPHTALEVDIAHDRLEIRNVGEHPAVDVAIDVPAWVSENRFLLGSSASKTVWLRGRESVDPAAPRVRAWNVGEADVRYSS